MDFGKIFYALTIVLDSFLIFAIGLKLVDPRNSLRTSKFWLAIGIFSTLILFERFILNESLAQLMGIVNLGLYLVFFLVVADGSMKRKYLAYLIMIVTLIASEIVAGVGYSFFTGFDLGKQLTDFTIRAQITLLANVVKFVVLVIVIRWKVRALER